MPKEFTTQWEVCDLSIDHVLDKTMKVLKEKEIAMKRPIFACVSATMEMGKAINLRTL